MSDDTDKRCAPKNKTDLFLSFTWLALQGFGGVLVVVQRELVERKKWLTLDEFVEDWAVAQILPGPNVVNLCIMIGSRHFGLMGAVAATAGILAVPTVLILLIAAAFAGIADTPAAHGILRGMGAVSAGLIAATGIKLITAVKNNPMGQISCLAISAVTFVGVGLMRLPLAWVLLGLGGCSCLWAWRCISQKEARRVAP